MLRLAVVALCFGFGVPIAHGQTPGKMSDLLAALSGDQLAASVNRGNAGRGAVLFHGPIVACGRCHSVAENGPSLLGPNLAAPLKEASLKHLLESLLAPSKVVESKFRGTQVLTEDGDVLTGLLVAENAVELQIKQADTQRTVKVPLAEIAQRKFVENSLMPQGLLDTLPNPQSAFDLLAYLQDIQRGGFKRARELQPTAAQLAIQVPDYEARIDHAGLIGELDSDSFDRGKAVYESLCINCHGTKAKPGSLATALRFGEGKFKFGDDPYSMYQTMTRGAGLMAPQPWMVPKQKYDVIHYIRQHFLLDAASKLSADYLAGLPVGSERGPEPREFHPWSTADYGPRLIGTYEIGRGGRNIAQKGIAVQLDAASGGVAQGRAWAVFDHDTMRLAGVWTSREFIDWQGIHFNGRHNIHPSIVGDILISNPNGPGWAHPITGQAEDSARVLGRDGKRYGPLPKDWATYKGLRQLGNQTVIDYRIGATKVSERFSWQSDAELQSVKPGETGGSFSGRFSRRLSLGERNDSLELVAATLPEGLRWRVESGVATAESPSGDKRPQSTFDGKAYFSAPLPKEWNTQQGFSVRARIQVKGDGTIFSIAPAEGAWAPGGQTLFLRNGRLTYDVGWVGALSSPVKLSDGKPHDVGLTIGRNTQLAKLYVDGELVGEKRLPIGKYPQSREIRVGKTCEDFPDVSQLTDGSVKRLECFAEELSSEDVHDWKQLRSRLACWRFNSGLAEDGSIVDSEKNIVLNRRGAPGVEAMLPAVWLNETDAPGRLRFRVADEQLLVTIPSGAPIEFVVHAADANASYVGSEDAEPPQLSIDDEAYRGKDAALFGEILRVEIPESKDFGQGFAIDEIPLPKQNPWQARMRLGGIDFYPDGDSAAVCTWDGDVWIVRGLSKLGQAGEFVTWQRYAFGLFQPLGIRIIDDAIHLTCRDQLVRLEDQDQDGFADYYRCLNNDHQVTEHFHEFAMGLQTDEAGNFYYAKSARHALPALVPHHGTLLRISADGAETQIVATGFRAANGVCLNPDGSFIVTDQEGHWNPKNRINWVRQGGFYGNMYGYHDVVDSSDSAMEQPLCWITNAFDRSPAELLWCDSPSWGPFKGSLLNLSYGYGKVFVVPHQKLANGIQGGMCQLPLPDFPTGLIRGRFSPADGELYVCGLAAWATSQTAEEGGLYRIRYTGDAAALPIGLEIKDGEIHLRFSEPLSGETNLDVGQVSVRVWNLERTKNYGSKHYDERSLRIRDVRLSNDAQTIVIEPRELEPTWGMEIRLTVTTRDGREVERVIHNTVHSTSGR